VKKGQAKPSGEAQPEQRWESMRAKCHPAIFELAQLWKDSIEALNRLGPNSSQESRIEIEAKQEQRLSEIKQKYSGPIQPAPHTFAAQTIFSESALNSEVDAQGVLEIIHFQRHNRLFEQDSEKMRAGDWDASRRIQRTFADLEQIRCGKGPIRKFKVDVGHWNIFETLWGFGIEQLTAEELADFLDKYCPCGVEEHDQDSLRKQRTRFKRILQKAIASKQSPES
jgi:hypothetical protein